ncbi:MAG TPA: hypothetical protein VJ952_05070, partial [Opitutales bacterium]|nr:hypothetical protein [Opitutales bacterium]
MLRPLHSQKTEQFGNGKILWVACDSFDKPSEENSKESMLEVADTPNLDALCRLSETGLMRTIKEREFKHAERFGDLTRLRSLAITNHSAHCVMERCFEFDRYETVRGLRAFEEVLEAEWDSFDFFYLHLDGEYKSVRELCDPEVMEWIEMVDAWLPGLL